MHCSWLCKDVNVEGIEFLPKESGENILQEDAVVLLPRIGSAISSCLQRIAPKACMSTKSKLLSLKKA